MPPGPTARPPPPAAENVSAPPAENSSPGCARCAAEWCQTGSRIPLVIALAVNSALAAPPGIAPRPGKTVPLPLRLQLEKPLPRLPGLPIQIAPEALLHLC